MNMSELMIAFDVSRTLIQVYIAIIVTVIFFYVKHKMGKD